MRFPIAESVCRCSVHARSAATRGGLPVEQFQPAGLGVIARVDSSVRRPRERLRRQRDHHRACPQPDRQLRAASHGESGSGLITQTALEFMADGEA